MPDTIGNISVPDPVVSATAFPLVSDFPAGEPRDYTLAVHTFGAGNRKREQRFLIGTGARKFTVQRSALSHDELNALRDFWEARNGPLAQFPYAAPNPDQTTTTVTCRFANEPLSFQALVGGVYAGQCTLIEVPSSAPSYSVSATVSRFPGSTLTTALLEQDHTIIPLIKITPKESGYPAIYLSDRRVTIGGQLYQARLIDWDGISQTIGSASDDASFSFGNADQVMTLLSADTDLYRASIEFSLFHVGSTIKLDLWKGEVIDFQDAEGQPFQVRASDGFYELRLPYPTRKISRTCWKDFDDGNACPYSSAGSGGDAAFCDKGYTTPKGCASHGMRRYFGGIIAEPQGVSIKDNSTGTWGYGRNRITASSIVNESVYDQVVPEVYTDGAMPVPAKIIAGRDEGEFYEALGIVCEGPVTFGSGHQLDRQYHHGYPGSLGLRTASGSDPAGSTDFLSLDQSGNQAGSDPEKVYSGSSTYKNAFSAGTAFVSIRRSDEKGLQLSRPTDHEISAIVATGLQGWVWSGAGSRTLQTLTNPVWVVINMMLRARGLRYANAATCEAYFDVTAAIAAANICDATVDKIAGLSGTETQYKYRGILQEERPLRDQIDDALLNCLGYYTFATGKLKIGVRSNSSVVEAFTTGNVLADSVRATPVRPSFNEIQAVFADENYEYAANSVVVYDVDHQKLVGGATSPLKLKTQVNLSGTSSASQAARLIAARLKEELGGSTAAEWTAARTVSFKTTVLALNVEPGMVCSLTHEKMPGGAGEFRVAGWRLNRDYSIDIEGRTTTDSMYDAVEGPKPADVLPASIPPEQISYPRRPGVPASARENSGPFFAAADAGSLGVTEVYTEREDGAAGATVNVSARLPINKFLAVPAPTIRGITQAATGGSLLAGRNYFVQVVPYQGTLNATAGPPSNILAVSIAAGADTGKITLADVAWPLPPSESWSGYHILAGHTESSICIIGSVSGSSLPSSVEIAGPMVYHGSSLAPNFDRARVKAKQVAAVGILRAVVTAVTSTTIVCASLAGGGDAFTGRIVSLLSDASDGSLPTSGIWNFTCTSYAESTGTFTFGVDPSSVVGVGDVIAVRLKATSATSTTIVDSGAAWTTDEHAGRLVRIISGTGRGQVRAVLSNTGTALTLAAAWATTPSTDSVFIVEEAGWGPAADSTPVPNESFALRDVALPIENVQATMLVAAFGVDRFGQESPEEEAPVRDFFVSGQAGTGDAAPPGDIQPISGQPFNFAADEYTDSNGVKYARLQFEYNPPATIGTFDGVAVYVNAPDLSANIIFAGNHSYQGDPGGSGSARYGLVTLLFPPPPTNETWRFYLVSKSASYTNALVLDGDPGETPNRAITINAVDPIVAIEPPGLPSAITGSDMGTRRGDPATGQVHGLIRAAITYPSGGTDRAGVTLWISMDNGSTYEEVGNFAPTSPIDFYWPVKDSNATAKLKVITFGPSGWNDVADAVESGGFTITGIAALAATVITDGLTSSITYAQQSNGSWTWGFTVSWTNPTVSSNPNFFAVACTVQKVDSGGTAATDYEGTERIFADRAGSGSQSVTIPNNWTIPTPGFKYRIRLYTVDVLQRRVLQTGAFSSAAYVELTPTEPTGSSGAEYAPMVASFTASVITSTLEDGSPGYQFDGSFSVSGFTAAQTASYGGCKIYAVPATTSQRIELADVPRGLTTFRTQVAPITTSQSFDLLAVSYDTSGRMNSIQAGTPKVSGLSVSRAVGSTGAENAGLVTSFAAAIETRYTEDGGEEYSVYGSGVAPSGDDKFAGAVIVATNRGSYTFTTGSGSATYFSGKVLTSGPHSGKRFTSQGAIYTISSISGNTINFTPNYASGGGAQEYWMLDDPQYLSEIAPGTMSFRTNPQPMPPSTEFWRVMAVSFDYAGRQNTLHTSTPGASLQLAKTVGAAGVEYCPNVSSVSTARIDVPNDAGIVEWTSTGTFTEPTDARYGGCRIMRNPAATFGGSVWTLTNPGIEVDNIPRGIGRYRIKTQFTAPPAFVGFVNVSGTTVTLSSTTSGSFPTDNATYAGGDIYINGSLYTISSVGGGSTLTIGSSVFGSGAACIVPARTTLVFLSYDTSGRSNSWVPGTTPQVIVSNSLQTNTLNLAKATPASLVTSAFASGIRPVAILASAPAAGTISTDTYPPGSYYYNTSDGITYKNVGGAWAKLVGTGDIQANAITATQIATGAITAGKVAAGAISTTELAATEILVGSSTGVGPTRFRVNDVFGSMIGFIGDLTTGTVVNGVSVSSGFKGAYLLNLRVGSNINSPNLYADAFGVTMTNVPVTINSGTGLTVNTNSITTSVNNASIAGVGGYAGVVCQANSSPFITSALAPNALYFLYGGPAGSPFVSLVANTLGGGTLSLRGLSGSFPSGGLSISVNNSGGITTTWFSGSTPLNMYNTSFNYVKPGGATGTITVIGGWIYSVT